MNYFAKSSALFIALCSFSSIGMCMDPPMHSDLDALNSKTKVFLETRKTKNASRRTGLSEAILLVEHRAKRGNLDTLPQEFVKKQIQHATEYAEKNFKPFKQKLLQEILADLNLSGDQGIDRILYNCTAARLMALSCLELEEETMMKNEEMPAFFKKAQTNSAPISVTGLKNHLDTPWDWTDRAEQAFYNVLVHLKFEEMKTYNQNPYNYAFLKILSPDGDIVTMLDEQPFIGTQTISYGMLNDLHFIGGALNPDVSAHMQQQYNGPFGVFEHDKDHYILWKRYISELERCNLKIPVMTIFREFYGVILEEKDIKTQGALFDFLFTLMHEDSPISGFLNTFKEKETVTKQDIFNEFATYNFPSGPTFRELGQLIATHGYEVNLNLPRRSSDPALEKYRTDMLNLLKKRIIY